MPSIALSASQSRRPPARIAMLAVAMSCLLAVEPTMVAAQAKTTTPTADRVTYAMDQAVWTPAPAIGWAANVAGMAAFARDEGIPTGTMKLNEGIAIATAAAFAEGQIDLDIKPLGYSDAGIVFHIHGAADGEFVYIRANPDCPAAQDCVQYAPVTHGLMGWNIYPNYQASAPITTTGWNHLTIQVSEGRMRVYLNHAAEPSIEVPHLLGLTHDGGIALKGPAVYANLVVQPRARPDLSTMIAPPRAPGVVMDWLVAPPTPFDRARGITSASIPSAGAWHPIEADATGLVNLGRAFGAGMAPAVSTGWLKTVIETPTAKRVVLHVGFAMQLSLFVNGVPVYRGSNPYYPEQSRLSPGGRIDMDNAVVAIDLRRGRNDIVLAVNNDWRADLPAPRPSRYGWAAEARLDSDEDGDQARAGR